MEDTSNAVKAVISALVEPAFIQKVHLLLKEHEGAFVGVQSGGEFGLACTEAHRAFKQMYEAKVDEELAAHGAKRESLIEFVAKGKDDNEGVYYLLDMLVSLGDFQYFVDLMVRRRDGKRVALPVNLRDAQDISELIFGFEEGEGYENEVDGAAGQEGGR